MHKIFHKTFFFVVGYSLLMVPTYVLPWLGSNSAIINAAGGIVGHGMTPQWWLHIWCLVMLGLISWSRGDFIGKHYLPAFPFLAAVFDMTPGLSMIPLVPTALHLTTIIIGLKVSNTQADTDRATSSGKVDVLAGLVTLTAIAGSVLFISTSKENISEFARQKSVIPEKANPPMSVVAPTPPEKVVVSPETPEKALTSPNNPEKIARQYTSKIDGEKNSASNKVKRTPEQKITASSDQSPKHKNDVAEIRYININE